jgi:hypothetical protein
VSLISSGLPLQLIQKKIVQKNSSSISNKNNF